MALLIDFKTDSGLDVNDSYARVGRSIIFEDRGVQASIDFWANKELRLQNGPKIKTEYVDVVSPGISKCINDLISEIYIQLKKTNFINSIDA